MYGLVVRSHTGHEGFKLGEGACCILYRFLWLTVPSLHSTVSHDSRPGRRYEVADPPWTENLTCSGVTAMKCHVEEDHSCIGTSAVEVAREDRHRLGGINSWSSAGRSPEAHLVLELHQVNIISTSTKPSQSSSPITGPSRNQRDTHPNPHRSPPVLPSSPPVKTSTAYRPFSFNGVMLSRGLSKTLHSPTNELPAPITLP